MQTSHDRLCSLLSAGLSVRLDGPPGCGKTERAGLVARACNHDFISFRAATKERPDFSGGMIPDAARGIMLELPLALRKRLENATKPTMLLADDIGQTPVPEQGAFMEWFDSGVLSPHVVLWGATNRSTDRAGVNTIIEPFRTRFDCIFTMPQPPKRDERGNPLPSPDDRPDGPIALCTWDEELQGWLDWAFSAGIPAEFIAWHRATSGRTLYTWQPSSDISLRFPDYRSWGRALPKLWRAGIRDLHSISSVLGKPIASEFLNWLDLLGIIPSPDQIRANPLTAPLPNEDNANALFFTASMLASVAQPRDAAAFVPYLRRMPVVYSALVIRDLGRTSNPRVSDRFTSHPEWIKLFNENQDLFAA